MAVCVCVCVSPVAQRSRARDAPPTEKRLQITYPQ